MSIGHEKARPCGPGFECGGMKANASKANLWPIFITHPFKSMSHPAIRLLICGIYLHFYPDDWGSGVIARLSKNPKSGHFAVFCGL